MHAHGARALEPDGGCNGEPLTSGCRAKYRPGSRSSCCGRLRGGAQGRAFASTRGERLGLITNRTRFSICDEDAWSGMHEPRVNMAPSRGRTGFEPGTSQAAAAGHGGGGSGRARVEAGRRPPGACLLASADTVALRCPPYGVYAYMCMSMCTVHMHIHCTSAHTHTHTSVAACVLGMTTVRTGTLVRL